MNLLVSLILICVALPLIYFLAKPLLAVFLPLLPKGGGKAKRRLKKAQGALNHVDSLIENEKLIPALYEIKKISLIYGK